MEHRITAHLIGAVAKTSGRSRHQQQPRRLHCAARDDDVSTWLHAGARVVRVRNIEVAYTGRTARSGVIDDFVRSCIWSDFCVWEIAKLFYRRNPGSRLRPLLAPA